MIFQRGPQQLYQSFAQWCGSEREYVHKFCINFGIKYCRYVISAIIAQIQLYNWFKTKVNDENISTKSI